jgi:hypothetical protein
VRHIFSSIVRPEVFWCAPQESHEAIPPACQTRSHFTAAVVSCTYQNLSKSWFAYAFYMHFWTVKTSLFRKNCDRTGLKAALTPFETHQMNFVNDNAKKVQLAHE